MPDIHRQIYGTRAQELGTIEGQGKDDEGTLVHLPNILRPIHHSVSGWTLLRVYVQTRFGLTAEAEHFVQGLLCIY